MRKTVCTSSVEFKKNIPHKGGFTLIELLIASSILMMIISMSVTIFFNSTRLNTYVELTDTLHFEARYAMEKIVREIQSSTIDYPEYYNYYVLSGSGEQFKSGENLGSNYSVYAKRFYNPGEEAGAVGVQGVNQADLLPRAVGVNDLGTWCQWGVNSLNGSPYTAPLDHSFCNNNPSLEVTEDFATGTNPYTGAVPTLPTQASAICDSTSEMFTHSKRDCSFTNNTDAHETDILFLISPDGETKTIISTEPWGASTVVEGNVVTMLKMVGEDTDNDGVRDNWECADPYYCQIGGGGKPLLIPGIGGNDTLWDLNKTKIIQSVLFNFAPISPHTLDITDLRFYIAPIEDPLKAYDEFPETIQPYVTVVMTAELNDPRVGELPVTQRSITLQTTVSTQVYHEIVSYTGE